MVNYCVVFGCNNRQSKENKSLHFHRFPLTNPVLCDKWVLAIGRKNWKPTKYSFICSDHFTKESYFDAFGFSRPCLKPHAVPSVFRYAKHRTRKKAIVCKERVVHQDAEAVICDATLAHQDTYVAAIETVVCDKNPACQDIDACNVTSVSQLERGPCIKMPSHQDTSASEIQPVACSEKPVSQNSDVGSVDRIVNITIKKVTINASSEHSVQQDAHISTIETTACNEKSAYQDANVSHTSTTPHHRHNERFALNFEEERSFTEPDNYSLTNERDKNKTPNRDKVLRRKVKTLQQKIRRQNKTIARLKEILRVTKSQKRAAGDVSDIFRNCFDDLPLEILLNALKNRGKKPSAIRYTEAMKKFATTLYFCSPKSYGYLRTMFHLPHPSCIKLWCQELG